MKNQFVRPIHFSRCQLNIPSQYSMPAFTRVNMTFQKARSNSKRPSSEHMLHVTIFNVAKIYKLNNGTGNRSRDSRVLSLTHKCFQSWKYVDIDEACT